MIIQRQKKWVINGFTLLELAISMSILATILLGLFAVIIKNQQTVKFMKEKNAAMNSLRLVATTLEMYVHSTRDLEEVYLKYGSGSKGYYWPYASAENGFNVSVLKNMGLSNVRVYSNGKPIKIECFVDENSLSLRRILPEPDLNFDGDSNDNLAAGGYLILPVRITIEWRGVCAPQNPDLYNKHYLDIILGSK